MNNDYIELTKLAFEIKSTASSMDAIKGIEYAKNKGVDLEIEISLAMQRVPNVNIINYYKDHPSKTADALRGMLIIAMTHIYERKDYLDELEERPFHSDISSVLINVTTSLGEFVTRELGQEDGAYGDAIEIINNKIIYAHENAVDIAMEAAFVSMIITYDPNMESVDRRPLSQIIMDLDSSISVLDNNLAKNIVHDSVEGACKNLERDITKLIGNVEKSPGSEGVGLSFAVGNLVEKGDIDLNMQVIKMFKEKIEETHPEMIVALDVFLGDDTTKEEKDKMAASGLSFLTRVLSYNAKRLTINQSPSVSENINMDIHGAKILMAYENKERYGTSLFSQLIDINYKRTDNWFERSLNMHLGMRVAIHKSIETVLSEVTLLKNWPINTIENLMESLKDDLAGYEKNATDQFNKMAEYIYSYSAGAFAGEGEMMHWEDRVETARVMKDIAVFMSPEFIDKVFCNPIEETAIAIE